MYSIGHYVITHSVSTFTVQQTPRHVSVNAIDRTKELLTNVYEPLSPETISAL